MRIISGYTDYYDSVQGLGIDTEDVYIRDANSIKHDDIKQPILHEILLNCPFTAPWIRTDSGDCVDLYRFNPMIVGFCGTHQLVYRYSDQSGLVVWLYSEREVAEFIEKHPATFGSLVDNYFPHKIPKWKRRFSFTRRKGWGSLFASDFGQETVGEAFDEVAKINVDEVFQSTKSPTFLVHFENDESFSVNKKAIAIDYDIRLCNLDYQRIVDPYTAFQEISMYRSGVLGTGEPVMVEISNEHKRDAHGFNEESFKNITPGKKAKRRANRIKKRTTNDNT